MIITLIIIAVLAAATGAYMQQSKFGKNPSGARLERIKRSAHYKDGQFHNLHNTTTLAEGHNYVEVLYDSYIKRKPRKYPVDRIPSVKTDLLNLAMDADVLVWFGHSSYFMQIDGKRILVDPVFSGNASPIPGTVKSFQGTDIYTVDDLPNIDYLFISHDHYDHVDYEILVALKSKVGKVICGLGVGEHFEYWGYDSNRIVEGDWGDRILLKSGFTAFVETARHFSGRGIATNKTL